MSDTITVISGQHKPSTSPGFEAQAIQPAEVELDTMRISDQLSKLVRMLDQTEMPKESSFEISEMVLDLTVTASGKLAFLAVGAEASAKSTVTVTLRRKQPAR